MALREIRVDGDPCLTKVCKEVKEMTDRTRTLIEDMFETMYDAEGAGLAAPQVGILKRLCVIDVSEDHNSPLVLINPKIVEESGEQRGSEGCLSVPDMVGIVTRPDHVVAEAFDIDMQPITIEADGFLARAICHELAHLDGHLYTELVEGDIMTVEEFNERYGQSEEEEEA